MVWLVSAGSLSDPLCLMEVCAAVRQGVPVFPVRLIGKGIQPLGVPMWRPLRLSTKPDNSFLEKGSADTFSIGVNRQNMHRTAEEPRSGGSGRTCEAEVAQSDSVSLGDNGVARRKEQWKRGKATDAFFETFSRGLPNSFRKELHRHRFLVRDITAAVRACLETIENDRIAIGSSNSSSSSGEHEVHKTRPKYLPTDPGILEPPTFDLTASSADHRELVSGMIGVGRRGPEGLDLGAKAALWNWDRLPRDASQAKRIRGMEAVPWRTDEELAQLIREECAETDDLAGKKLKLSAWEGGRGGGGLMIIFSPHKSIELSM